MSNKITYDDEFKNKVIAAVNEGMKVSAAAKEFNVSMASVKSWCGFKNGNKHKVPKETKITGGSEVEVLKEIIKQKDIEIEKLKGIIKQLL